MLGSGLIDPILTSPDYLVNVAANKTPCVKGNAPRIGEPSRARIGMVEMIMSFMIEMESKLV